MNVAFLKEKDIRVVYLDIIVGEDTYKDGDLTNEALFAFIDKGYKVSTSQPGTKQIYECLSIFFR